ncbi:14217_t:CDS:2, partial [Acaulospora morrowiae]
TQPFCDLEIIVKPPVLIPRWETEEWTHRLITRLMQFFEKSYLTRLSQSSNSPFRILDICTGSGCIALSLARSLPPNSCHIHGIDISSDALSLANINLENINKKRKFENHVEFLHLDILQTPISEIKSFVQKATKYNYDEENEFNQDNGFDLIVSNPPYITHNEYATLDPDVRLWEDKCAL